MSKLDKNAIKKKKGENTQEATTTENNLVLDKLRKKKKEDKYRTSVYLKPSVFEKLITLNAESGESFTNIIEMLLEEALADVTIKPRHVEKYKKNLEKKQASKEQKKDGNEA